MKNFKKTIAILLVACFALGIQSCKKNKDEEDLTDDTAELTQHSSDESSQTAESDMALDDVNIALSNSGFGKGEPIAGAVIDSTGPKSIRITYNGNNAEGTRHRVGVTTIELTTGTRWRDINSVVTITFTNLKITKLVTGKSMTINGNHMITNSTGGTVATLTPGTSIKHRIGGTMRVTFDNATERSWVITRDREIGLTSNSIPFVRITGYGNGNAAVTGTNRAGKAFTTSITTPVEYNKAYGNWMAVSGVKVHSGLTRSATVTFGVDQSGNPVTGVKPYGFKVEWTNARGQSKTAVISY